MTALSGVMLAHALKRPVEYHCFDEALSRSPEFTSAVAWRSGPALDRAFGPVEAQEAGRALTEAWSLHGAALATQNTDYLADRFSGVALAFAFAAFLALPPETY